MSLGYRAVGWNHAKKLYDLALLGSVLVYLGIFVGAGALAHPSATIETLLIRAFGTAAFLLLHVILSIGPLCRLFPRFLPLLYNRRHMGVTLFMLALAHGEFGTIQFHALGNLNPLVSLLGGDPGFQTLGLIALVILFLMAATSHDFWLAQLTAPVWKSLHMAVYGAYALVVLHVALGALHSESRPMLAVMTGLGLAWLIGLHLAAGLRERAADRERSGSPPDGWLDACAFDEIEEGRARIVCASGERIAIFRYAGKVSAVSNLCRHQNGPLGEGKIVDGCITCPWHGYQYVPESGRSPAPFTEKIATFEVSIVGARVLVNPRPNPPGTPVRPAEIGGSDARA